MERYKWVCRCGTWIAEYETEMNGRCPDCGEKWAECVPYPKRKRKAKFSPSKANCPIDITGAIESDTEKAYKVAVGGHWSSRKANSFVPHYEFVAKSICYSENGTIYAPEWSVKGFESFAEKQNRINNNNK